MGDLQRIWDEEAEFLESSDGVFFESTWALEQARTAYGLRGNHYHAIGVAGGLGVPPDLASDYSPYSLISVANNFRQKGGDLTFLAVKRLRLRFPQLEWHIVGGRPDFGVDRLPGVIYEGVLNADSAKDMQHYMKLLGGAGILVHPTREDMNPLVLIEAAGYGCPAVSVRDFAIPELVADGETGLLLPRPLTPESLAGAIETLICDSVRYQRMRVNARERALRQFSWDVVGAKLAALISDALGVVQ
jgi:glycosyltransferase involved in cell wall biosynthesis